MAAIECTSKSKNDIKKRLHRAAAEAAAQTEPVMAGFARPGERKKAEPDGSVSECLRGIHAGIRRSI